MKVTVSLEIEDSDTEALRKHIKVLIQDAVEGNPINPAVESILHYHNQMIRQAFELGSELI